MIIDSPGEHEDYEELVSAPYKLKKRYIMSASIQMAPSPEFGMYGISNSRY